MGIFESSTKTRRAKFKMFVLAKCLPVKLSQKRQPSLRKTDKVEKKVSSFLTEVQISTRPVALQKWPLLLNYWSI